MSYKDWPNKTYNRKSELPYSRDPIPFRFNPNDPRHQRWANLQAHVNYLLSRQAGDIYNTELAQYTASVKRQKDTLGRSLRSEQMRNSGDSGAARRLF